MSTTPEKGGNTRKCFCERIIVFLYLRIFGVIIFGLAVYMSFCPLITNFGLIQLVLQYLQLKLY